MKSALSRSQDVTQQGVFHKEESFQLQPSTPGPDAAPAKACEIIVPFPAAVQLPANPPGHPHCDGKAQMRLMSAAGKSSTPNPVPSAERLRKSGENLGISQKELEAAAN
jgi:hypothetical protein